MVRGGARGVVDPWKTSVGVDSDIVVVRFARSSPNMTTLSSDSPLMMVALLLTGGKK